MSRLLDSGAQIDGEYRWRLWRRWDEELPLLLWVMLNPSTADATEDDPTIRKCVGFAMRWRYGGIVVVNLFALRSTDPTAVLRHPDPIGSENDAVISATAAECPDSVCAWGSHKSVTHRALVVRRLLLQAGNSPTHLGLNKDGHPKHPLYLPYSTSRELWTGAPA